MKSSLDSGNPYADHLTGSTAVEVFDIFLSHNSADKPAVEDIAHKLKYAGVKPWLDKWCLVPGKTFQSGLADALRNCATCAVFIGPAGVGNWAREEILVAQDRAAKETSYRLIPILLPGVPDPFDYSKLPPFLTQRTWVDFRTGLDDNGPLRVLVNAIKGKPPGPDGARGQADNTCPIKGGRGLMKTPPSFSLAASEMFSASWRS